MRAKNNEEPNTGCVKFCDRAEEPTAYYIDWGEKNLYCENLFNKYYSKYLNDINLENTFKVNYRIDKDGNLIFI